MKLNDILNKTAVLKKEPDLLLSGKRLAKLRVNRVPTGVFMFDMQTQGGIPLGRITIFWGSKSCGKTTMALRVTREYQKMFPKMKVLFVDYEQALDYDWISKFVHDPDRITVLRPDYGEQGIDFTKTLALAEDIGLIIVDSLAEMIPTKEAESSAEDDTVGLQARLINKFLRKMIPIMSKVRRTTGRELTMLLLNQVTSIVGGKTFGAKTKKVGSLKQEHIASMDIRFYNLGYTKRGKGKVPVKVKQQFTLTKNKVGLPVCSGEFESYLVAIDGFEVGESDDYAAVMTYAKRAGLLTRPGSKCKLDNKEFRNENDVMSYLLEDEEAFIKLKESTLKAFSGNLLLGTGSDEEDTESKED